MNPSAPRRYSFGGWILFTTLLAAWLGSSLTGCDDDDATSPESLTCAFTPQDVLETVPAFVEFESTVAGGRTPYLYNWDFGDGYTSTEAHPTHTFSVTGTYPVTLTVSDADGTTCQSDGVVEVGPAEFTCSIDATPTRGPAPLGVEFEAEIIGGQTPYAFLWDFADGKTSTTQDPVHTFDEPGLYPVQLQVIDGAQDSCHTAIDIHVE